MRSGTCTSSSGPTAQVAAITGYDRFWAFAAAVADQHYPAVAGLLPDAPEYQI